MYTTNKSTKSIADAALRVMMDEAKSPAQQAAIAIAMKEKGQKPKEEMKEGKLHPNQQVLDVHEPEKDELTKKDFEMLRKGKKAKVTEGTVAGEILKKIDEMKGPWPGTPEYKKKFPDREMKPGETKETKTGTVKKTIKGIVHTSKPMKEEVEVQQEEVKVLAKEEVSFQNLINLYIDNGVDSLLETIERLKEEASNDEYHKEVEENKKKAEGKVQQPEIAKGAVKAVAVTKEEVVAEGSETYKQGHAKFHTKTNKQIGPTHYGRGSDKKADSYTKADPRYHEVRPVKEEVELDEASYSAKAARAGEDIGKPGKMFNKIAASAAKRYGSEERGKKVAGAVLAKLRKEEIEELTDDQIEMIFEQIDAQLNERSMSDEEMKKREDIVKGMKKNLAGFKERYGEKAKSVMYATATARAKGE